MDMQHLREGRGKWGRVFGCKQKSNGVKGLAGNSAPPASSVLTQHYRHLYLSKRFLNIIASKRSDATVLIQYNDITPLSTSIDGISDHL
jgi:hypothetical protein